MKLYNLSTHDTDGENGWNQATLVLESIGCISPVRPKSAYWEFSIWTSGGWLSCLYQTKAEADENHEKLLRMLENV